MAKKKIDTPRSFAHDSNARNSAKIIRLRMAHGAAGYGVYFMLLERLRESPDYRADVDYATLAYDLREDPELIRSVIEDFGLFALSDDGRTFSSETLSARLGAIYVSKEEKVANVATETEVIPETNPEAIPEPSPESIPEPSLKELLTQAGADREFVSEFADKHDCTHGYVIKNLRRGFHSYCLENSLRPRNLDELRPLFSDWMSGTI